MKLLLLSLLLPLCSLAQNSPANFVNPFIGTGGHGHTFPGATTPFGMVQLSPDTRIDGSWDGCSGYHYSDSVIYGFSHTHLSGTGVSDYGDIMLMPMNLEYASSERQNYQSNFNHKKEKAGAGWYEVYLEKHKIKAELTASTRVGFHRYTLEGKSAAIILDLQHRDELLEGKIEQVDAYRIRGMRRSKAWATDQVVYYEMVFSQKISSIKGKSNSKEGDLNAIIEFGKMSSNMLEIKVGLSFASQEGAHLNLETEAKSIKFDEAKENAIANWNTELNRIQVQGGTEEQKHIFYTALYHTMIQPNTASDVDGHYRGMDKNMHKAEGFTYYSVFSLWDTFRAAHPLYSILYPKRTEDFIKTFLAMYSEGGRLPVWELASNETDCMIGYHSVSIIADAWAKGIRGFDSQLALEAMQKSATWNHLGIPSYIKNGQITIDDEPESVSKTLEYAYDDWCISRFAEDLGNKGVQKEYAERSEAWRNLYDFQTGFMRPKKNSAWLNPFDPREVNNHFTEANSWQYSFFVPHNMSSFAVVHGGKQALLKQLKGLFEADSKTTGREQSDITGLIGQYAHGNEPSHHIAWMFSVLGEPALTQQYVSRILKEMYSNSPDGLSGNEDCGQMSAWYVFGAMGFYPFCPGIPNYVVSAPLFSEISITPVDGKTFLINADNATNNGFVQRVNGGNEFSFSHSLITEGGTLNLEMSSNPPASQDLKPNPFSLSWESKYTPNPVFSNSQQVFRDSMKVEIMAQSPDAEVYYTMDGTEANSDSKKAIGEISPINSSQLKAIAIDKNGLASHIVSATYSKIPHNYTIEIKSKYNPQYSAGGDNGIIDGLSADENWRKGGWQGYQGQDFECIIDLQKVTLFNSIDATFLQETRSWIVFPSEVTFEISNNGKDFEPYCVLKNNVDAKDYTAQIKHFAATNNKEISSDARSAEILVPTKARYIRVIAKNYGIFPSWHQGAGNEAFIFIDEIAIK